MRPQITQYLVNEEGKLLQGLHIMVTLGIKRSFLLTNLRGGVGRLNFILARGEPGYHIKAIVVNKVIQTKSIV